MSAFEAHLLQSRLTEIKQLIAVSESADDAVLWAMTLTLEAADQLLRAYLAGDSGAAEHACRHALLEAISNTRAATVAVAHAIRAPADQPRDPVS